MTTPTLIFSALVWISLIGLAVFYLRQPRKRKTSDELEALVASIKNRTIDLEDRLEHFVKRAAVRASRDAKDVTQSSLDLGSDPMADRRNQLAALRARVASERISRGAL